MDKVIVISSGNMLEVTKMLFIERCRRMPAVLLVGIGVFLMAGCNGGSPNEPDGPTIATFPVAHSGCKVFAGDGPDGFTPPLQTCFIFSYDGVDTLRVSRVNAAFNCCPDSLFVEVALDDSTITITEKEDLTGGGCYCLCLFDLDYTIAGVPPGSYRIRVVEPYRDTNETNPALQFSVDLAITPSGTFCVQRSGYPWGEEDTLAAAVTDVGGCQEFGSEAVDTGQLLNCAVWTYDGSSTLEIDRLNAIFNCCTDSVAVVAGRTMDTIVIVEQEFFIEQSPCRCICPFNLTYEIRGLPPGAYALKVIGPQGGQMGDLLVFDVDLTADDTGSYCVPWPY
jgi:hypothetical protein